MFGVGEVVVILLFVKVVFNWFLCSECGFVSSIFDSGLCVGFVLLLLFVVWLILFVGWCGLFVIMGGIGIVWVLVWWFVYCDLECYCVIVLDVVDVLFV